MPSARRSLAIILALAAAAVMAPAATAATTTLPAESLSLTPGAGTVFSDSAAGGGSALLIWSNGSASGTATTTGARSLVVRARGDQCAGAPHMVVTVDGRTVLTQDVGMSTWAAYGTDLSLADGSHSIKVAFTNDYSQTGCDRNLRVDAISFSDKRSVEAESMALTSGAGATFPDAAASGGQGMLVWSNGTASASYVTSGAGMLSVTVRGDLCAGAPHMVVAVDGKTALERDVPDTTWTTYSAPVALSDASHKFTIAFTNDYSQTGCDRNLRIDSLTVAAVPLPALKLYVDPNSNAKRQADAWRLNRPADAAEMDKIAAQPEADWFGDWSGDIQTAVSARVSTIAATGATAVLVAYDIPQRDCGSYSAGGATSAAAYKSWIRGFAAGIGTRSAIVVLEPDALASMDCLSAADQSTRLSLLGDAVSVLASHAGVRTYIDAGNSSWQTASVMAGRLRSAAIAQATGFSLNVSNFLPTADERTYGDQLASLVGGKHFIVDTSRNGLGAGSTWCNPSGRALGDRPTTATGDPLADAWLWIKAPGESDGTCNGGPAAGQWWADYALGLAQRAAY